MTNELLRQLALEARELECGGESAQKKRTTSTKPTWSITLAENPDLIITKTTPRTTKHLIILFTAGKAFIKTVNANGTETSEMLTPENYSSFSNGMPTIMLPDGFWAKSVVKGADFGRTLLYWLNNETYVNAAKRKYLGLFSGIDSYIADTEAMLRFFEKYLATLFDEFGDRQKLKILFMNTPILLGDVVARFGMENARDFLREYDLSVCYPNFANSWRANCLMCSRRVRAGLFDFEKETQHTVDIAELREKYGDVTVSTVPITKMTYEKFKEYVIYGAVRFGYADSLDKMLTIWSDTLNMQYMLYGKIREKYPDNLPTVHDVLSYKMRIYRQEIDERKFADAVEKAKQYEGESGDYLFVTPKSKQDMIEEATAQANCLAGYVNSFADGNCTIIFMRKKEAPDVSYVTIEVRNGTVRQAYFARNKRIPDEMRRLIDLHVASCQ